jgi:hypothetical protein
LISTSAYNAILIAIGIFPAQSAVLESYEANWDNLPTGVTSVWEFILDVDNEYQSLVQVFADFPASPGFWVWEGNIIVESRDPLDTTLNGEWRRATVVEVTSWDEATRSVKT